MKDKLSSLDYYKDGLKRFENQEFDAAILSFSEAIKTWKDKSAGYELDAAFDHRGKCHLMAGQHHEALRDYTEAMRLDPSYHEYPYNRGTLYAILGEKDKAIQDLSKAIDLNPKDADSFFQRAEVFRKSEKFDEAIKDYEKALEIEPRHENALGYLEVEAAKRIKDFSEEIKSNPSNFEARVGLGDTYFDIQEYESANKNYFEAIKLNKNDADLNYNIANTFNKMKEFQSALEYYDKVVALDDKYEDAFFGRACTYAQVGNLDNAIQDFSKVLEINPSSADAQRKLGEIYYMREEYDKAEFDLTAAALLAPEKYGQDLKELIKGVVSKKQMDAFTDLLDSFAKENSVEINRIRKSKIPEDALIKIDDTTYKKEDLDVNEYKKTIKDNPENKEKVLDTYLNIGQILTEQEDYKDAIKNYCAAVDMGYNNSDIQCEIARCYSYLAKEVSNAEQYIPQSNELMDYTQKTIEHYDKAIELDNNNGKFNRDAYFGKGLAHEMRREVPAALENFNTVIQKDSNDLDAHFQKGLCYAAISVEERAKENIENAKKLDEQAISSINEFLRLGRIQKIDKSNLLPVHMNLLYIYARYQQREKEHLYHFSELIKNSDVRKRLDYDMNVLGIDVKPLLKKYIHGNVDDFIKSLKDDDNSPDTANDKVDEKELDVNRLSSKQLISDNAKIRVDYTDYSVSDYNELDVKKGRLYKLDGNDNQLYSVSGLNDEIDSRAETAEKNNTPLKYVVKDDKTGKVLFSTNDKYEIKIYLNIKDFEYQNQKTNIRIKEKNNEKPLEMQG